MIATTITPKRHLYFIRAYYFILIGGGGFLFPFITIFYRRQGLSGTEIGIIGTIQAIAGLIAAPMWGRWSDATGRVRRLLQISFVLTAVSTLLLGRQSSSFCHGSHPVTRATQTQSALVGEKQHDWYWEIGRCWGWQWPLA